MSANTAPITFGKITLGSLIGCLLAASASFAVVGFVLVHVRSADAKTADAKSAEVASPSIWTVSGPFEALGSQGVAEMFLLENPAIGYRLVSKNEIAGLEAQEPVKKIIPYAARESRVGVATLYTPVLRLPQKQ